MIASTALSDHADRAAVSQTAPDPGWLLRAATADGALIWGERLGSAAQPYLVVGRPAQGAWRCECASRADPCRHAQELSADWTTARATFATAEPPLAVRAWALSPRSAASIRVLARRADAARADRRAAALGAFGRWLEDVQAAGLAAFALDPQTRLEPIADRLRRDGAAGLARLATAAAHALAAHPEADRITPAAMMIARLWTLWRAESRRDRLEPAAAAELDRLIRGRVDRTATTAIDPHARWIRVGSAMDGPPSAPVRAQWFTRWTPPNDDAPEIAQLSDPIEAAAPLSRIAPTPAAIAVFDGTFAFHPAPTPALAEIVDGRLTLAADPPPARTRRLADARRILRRRLAAAPWTDAIPIAIGGAHAIETSEGWRLSDDAESAALPDPFGPTLAALSAAGPVSVVGAFDGRKIRPVAAWSTETMWSAPPLDAPTPRLRTAG